MAIMIFITGEYEVEPDVKSYILDNLDRDYKNVTTDLDVRSGRECFFVDVPGIDRNKKIDVVIMEPPQLGEPDGYTAFSNMFRGRYQGYYR